MLEPRHSVQPEADQCVEFKFGIPGTTSAHHWPLRYMRAPTSSAKPLIPTSPLIRPVKSPIGEVKPATASILRPIKKLGTPEIQPVTEEIVPETEIDDTITEEISDTEELVQEPTTDDTSEIGHSKAYNQNYDSQQQPRTTIAKLTPVKHMLEPEQKSRGAPPPKDLGKKTCDE